MKRKWIASLLAVLCLMALTGCGPSLENGANGWTNTPSKNTSSVKNKNSGDGVTDQSGEFTYSGELQQIGDEEHGYLKIPAAFKEYHEEGVEGLLQYASEDGSTIVTLQYYEKTPYTTVANNFRYYLESQENFEGLTGATVTINGYDALQLYGHYSTDNSFLVVWLIQNPDNTEDSFYLALEFPAGDEDIIGISSTFETPGDHTA